MLFEKLITDFNNKVISLGYSIEDVKFNFVSLSNRGLIIYPKSGQIKSISMRYGIYLTIEKNDTNSLKSLTEFIDKEDVKIIGNVYIEASELECNQDCLYNILNTLIIYNAIKNKAIVDIYFNTFSEVEYYTFEDQMVSKNKYLLTIKQLDKNHAKIEYSLKDGQIVIESIYMAKPSPRIYIFGLALFCKFIRDRGNLSKISLKVIPGTFEYIFNSDFIKDPYKIIYETVMLFRNIDSVIDNVGEVNQLEDTITFSDDYINKLLDGVNRYIVAV